MSEPRHTRGPWGLKSDSSSGCSVSIKIMGLNETTVCSSFRHAWDSDTPSKPEFMANAHLIAAAPDMIAELESICEPEFVENLEAWAEEFRQSQHGATLTLLRVLAKIRSAKDAIAKAKGDA